MKQIVPSFRLVALAVALSSLLAVMSSSLFAQGGESGGVAGIVKDPTGAVVSGASVDVYSEQTKQVERQTVTTSAGNYSVGSLHPGPYRVEVTAKGFRKSLVRIDVRLNEVERRDITLEVGSTAETVEVTAAGTLVNTEGPTTGQPIDNQTLSAIPLANPDYLFLLGLSPGASLEPPDVRRAGRATVDITVNGQRTSNNSVTMEGININDLNLAHFDNLPIPNPAAIQEFKVATSLYDASQGSKGGGALALVLKSGSKGLHFGANWQVRNDYFNANEWFNKHQTPEVRRGKLTQNVIDLQAGGPIPVLKGFWYFNVAGSRGRNGIDLNGAALRPAIAAFPTAADGTTSAALLAGDPNMAGLVTAAQIDPVAVNILNAKSSYYGGTYAIPRVGEPGCDSSVTPGGGGGSPDTFNCVFNKKIPSSDTQYTGRYDRPLRGDKDKLAISVFWDDGKAQRPYGTAADLAGAESNTLANRFGTLSYTTQISNRQLNEVKFGANRFVFANKPTDLLTVASVGSTRANSAQFPGLFFFNTGTFTFGTGVNDDRGTASNTYQIGDNWSMTVGKHNLRAGGDIYRYELNRFNNFGVRGSLGFAPIGATESSTAWLNFIQGIITSTQSGAGNPLRYFRAHAGDLYLQDDYRWSPKLTINLGLRWEPMQFAHDKLFRNSNYDFRIAKQGLDPFLFPASLNQSGVRGTPGVSDCTLKHCWDKNNFAPRIGFAWDVYGNQKTVVRGGYGIYFQQISNQAELQGSLGAPFFVSLITTRTNGQGMQLANPLPNQGAGGGGVVLPQYVPTKTIFAGVTGDINDPTAVVNWTDAAGNLCGISGGSAIDCGIDAASFTSSDPNLHAPYTQQWNLTVQRELGHNWALELGYVGSHGVGGIAIWVPFQALLASPTSPIVATDSSGTVYHITANTTANESLREQAPGLTFGTGASYTSNVGNQIFHSAQVTLSHRFEHGLFFQTGYTWSRNIDNVSGAITSDELNGSTGRGGAAIYNDQSNPGANRALSDLDRRHRLVFSYSYELPVPKSGVFGTQVFQGWGVSGLMTFQSGQVFSVADATAGGAYGFVLGTPLAICRDAAHQISGVPACTPGTPTNPLAAVTPGSVENRLGHYVNPNFFSHPLPVANNNDAGATGFGTSMRNIYRGPFQQDVDFAVTKTFHITERHQFAFRADAFNLFNHPVFSIPTCSSCLDLGQSRANFGKITTTAIPARLMQFELKYSF